jgi:hypothetical protein
MTKRSKPDRDPISWTKDRHHVTGSVKEICVVTGHSVSYVRAKIEKGDYRVIRDGRVLDIIVDSVFEDLDRLAAAPPDQPPKPKGGPGRPRKSR